MRATAVGLLLLLAGLSTAAPASASSNLDDWGTPLPGECCLDVAVATDHDEVLILVGDAILRFSGEGAPIGRIPVEHGRSFAVDGDRLYLLSGDPVGVSVWDLHDLGAGIQRETALELADALEITVAAGSVWVSGWSDASPLGELMRIEPDNLAVAERFPMKDGRLLEGRSSDDAAWLFGAVRYCRVVAGAQECWATPGDASYSGSFGAAPGENGDWLFVTYPGSVERLLPGGELDRFAETPGRGATTIAVSPDAGSVALAGLVEAPPGTPEILIVGDIEDSRVLGDAVPLFLEFGDEGRLFAGLQSAGGPVRFGVVDEVAVDIEPPRGGPSFLSLDPLPLALITVALLSIVISLMPVTRPAPDPGAIRRGRRDAARYLQPAETVEGHVFGYQAQSVGGWLVATGLLWVLASIVGITVSAVTGSPAVVLVAAMAIVVGFRMLMHHMLRPHRIVLTDRCVMVLPVHPFTWKPSGPGVEMPRGTSSSSWRRGMTTWARFGTEDPVWVPPFWAQELRRIAEAESASPPLPARPDR